MIGTPLRIRRLHLVARDQVSERELEDLGDLACLGSPGLRPLHDPYEREDSVSGDERADGRKRADKLHAVRIQADLLVGLAQRGHAQVLVGLVLAPARERDLARVAAEIITTFGQDGGQRIAVERHQHGGVLVAGRVHGRGLFRGEEVLPHAPIIRTVARALLIVDFQNDFTRAARSPSRTETRSPIA